MAGEPGVDEAGGGVGEQAEPAQARLALDARGDVVGQGDGLEGRCRGRTRRGAGRTARPGRPRPAGSGRAGPRRGSMTGYLWLSNSRKNLSSRTSMLRRLDHRRVPRVEDGPGRRRSRRGCRGRRAARGQGSGGPCDRRRARRAGAVRVDCRRAAGGRCSGPFGPARGRSSMVERQLPKLDTRVRFPSPAQSMRGPPTRFSSGASRALTRVVAGNRDDPPRAQRAPREGSRHRLRAREVSHGRGTKPPSGPQGRHDDACSPGPPAAPPRPHAPRP